MNFSSVQLAEIDGLLDVNRDFCKLEMQQSRLGKAERDQPALESKGSREGGKHGLPVDL